MSFYWLYLLTVLIWGTTWLAIRYQLGEVSPEVSIFYRFSIAAFIMHFWCLLNQIKFRFSIKEHGLLFLLGILIFSVHYIFVYKATGYILSGMVALIFSMTSLFNILNAFLFTRNVPEIRTLAGAAIGVLGISAFFFDDLVSVSLEKETMMGIGISLIGSYMFSLGNMLTKHCQKKNMALVPSVTIAMSYGAIVMFMIVLITSQPLTFPTAPSYWISLLYLAIPGSVIAFLSYLKVIQLIGPEKAGYATVLYPIVALWVSYFVEGFTWNISDVLGLLLVVAGNILIMGPRRIGLSRS